MSGLCETCRELKDVAHTDELGREYCAECLASNPDYSIPFMFAYLVATIPFHVGDKVEARTAGALFDGVGVIDKVSVNLSDWGTPVYPSFHVVIEDKAYPEAPDDLWYTESCLTKVDQ